MNDKSDNLPQNKDSGCEGDFEVLKREFSNSPVLRSFFLGAHQGSNIEFILRELDGKPKKQKEFAEKIKEKVGEKEESRKEPELPNVPSTPNRSIPDSNYDYQCNYQNNYYINISVGRDMNMGDRSGSISQQKTRQKSNHHRLETREVPTLVLLIIISLICAFFTSPLVSPPRQPDRTGEENLVR